MWIQNQDISKLVNRSNNLSCHTIDCSFEQEFSHSFFQKTATCQGEQNQRFFAKIEQEVNSSIKDLDASSLEHLEELNKKRRLMGKTTLNISELQSQIETILNSHSLSEKEKKQKLRDLAEESGLSKENMRNLFSRRMAKSYECAAKQLKLQYQRQEKTLQIERARLEKIFGKNSPQVTETKRKEALLKSSFQAKIKNYQSKASTLKDAFKKPGFFSRIFGGISKAFSSFFGGITKVLSILRPLLSRIPIFGKIANSALGIVQNFLGPFKNLFQGKVLSFFKDWGQGFIKNLSHATQLAQFIPGIGNIARAASVFAQPILQKVSNWIGARS